MATMALASGKPCALLNLLGGVVEHVRSLVPEAFFSCDSDSEESALSELGGGDTASAGMVKPVGVDFGNAAVADKLKQKCK